VIAAAPALAISSWSVHRALGFMFPNRPDNDVAGGMERKWQPGGLSLADLPAALRRFGVDAMHLCHFHLASRDTGYLREIRATIEDAGVVLNTLLIDDGDIAHPALRERDLAWIGRWIDAAAELGALRARVIPGKQKPTPETLKLAVEGLRALARRSAHTGVRIVIENWFDLAAGPTEVNELLDRLEGEVGLLVDFGNWKGPRKYADLAAIFGRAEDTHAKAHFTDGGAMDDEDFARCLAAAVDAGYRGPYTLIYEGPDADEWEAIASERAFLTGFFATYRGAAARKAG
jgi:sugar phosphate isomerase/epimerase